MDEITRENLIIALGVAIAAGILTFLVNQYITPTVRKWVK